MLADLRPELNDMDDRYQIFGTLFLLSNKLETIGNDFLGELTTKQWCFMLVLQTFFSTPPTLSELAVPLGTSHQNVKQIALRLEHKGFVRLEKDTRDNRILRVSPTQLAEDYGTSREEKDNAFIHRLFRDFDDETLSTVKNALFGLHNTLEKMQKENIL